MIDSDIYIYILQSCSKSKSSWFSDLGSFEYVFLYGFMKLEWAGVWLGYLSRSLGGILIFQGFMQIDMAKPS